MVLGNVLIIPGSRQDVSGNAVPMRTARPGEVSSLPRVFYATALGGRMF